MHRDEVIIKEDSKCTFTGAIIYQKPFQQENSWPCHYVRDSEG